MLKSQNIKSQPCLTPTSLPIALDFNPLVRPLRVAQPKPAPGQPFFRPTEVRLARGGTGCQVRVTQLPGGWF